LSGLPRIPCPQSPEFRSVTLGALGQDQCAERNDIAGKILRISEHMR
jgi:hypothetical protein